MNHRKARKRVLGGVLVALMALMGILVAATPARAASGDTFTVVNHLTITLDPSNMSKSTISGPSVGGTVTFADANSMFADAGGTGSFVTYANGVYTANFENAAVKDKVNGENVYFNLGHMLLGDPYNTLFEGGNAITVQGSGSIVFKNLDVSILGDTAGSGTDGTDTTEGGNIANGLLTGTNTIFGVGSGCTVTLGDGVDIDTATPVNDNSGKTVKCNAILASSGGTINIGSPTGSAQAQAIATSSEGAVIDGTARATGNGKIVVYKGIVASAGDGVTAGNSVITATVGGQTVMGSTPMYLNDVTIPSGTVTVTSAPKGATIYTNSSTTVRNGTTSTDISVGVTGGATQIVKPNGTLTPSKLSAKEALQLAVTNAETDNPASASSKYTKASWDAYQKALTAAKDLLASTQTVTNNQYEQAATALQTAIDGLVVNGPNLAALQQAVDDAQRLVGTDSTVYPANEWQAYQTALNAAQAILDNPAGSTSADMNGARSDLQKAVAALVSVVYRLYNPYDELHLFTTDANEYETLLGYGWNDEGVAWNAPAGAAGNTAVYRLYNNFNGDHYYTTNKAEADGLVALFPNGEGWAYDNGAKPIFYSCPANGNGIYQLFNPYRLVDTHIWTANKLEYDTCQEQGWTGENIKFYAISLPE